MTQAKPKGRRFTATLIAAAVAAVTAAVYAIIYASTRFISWTAFGLLLGGAAVAGGMLAIRKYRFAPSLLLGTGMLAAAFYLYHIYFFISSVATGIQFSGFPPEFFINIVCFVLTIALAIAAIFTPMTAREAKE